LPAITELSILVDTSTVKFKLRLIGRLIFNSKD
jgi:hypothetical protein